MGVVGSGSGLSLKSQIQALRRVVDDNRRMPPWMKMKFEDYLSVV